MPQQPSYIVMQCYGNESIFHECAHALLTLSAWYRDKEVPVAAICIYTDNEAWFREFKGNNLPLQFRKIDNALIRQWKGSIDFVHRVKIEVLKDFVSNHEGNILYLDTDVVFTQPIEQLLSRIDEGDLFMHVMEGKVHDAGNLILKKLSAFLNGHRDLHINGRSVSVAQDVTMWNAGVLGFNTKYAYLLDDILAFTDIVHQKFSKHIVEQFAFSLFFQHTAQIHTAAPYILHYWNLKEARLILASFFQYFKGKDWNELVRYAALIQIHVPMQEKVSFLENRSIWGKIQKIKWQPVIPDWAELLKQL
jgi:hypothetical protein